MPFVKLDCGIIHSSLWAESSDTRICWITLLVLADATGFVRAAVSAIAREAGISAESARRALDLFAAPDDESRSPENKGKRIELVEGGYRVLNYEKYRAHDYTGIIRQRRFRAKNKKKRNTVTPLRNGVTTVTVTQAEAEAEAEAEPSQSTVMVYAKEISLSDFEAQKFFDHFTSNGWKVGGKTKMKDWQAALRNWKRNIPQHTNFPNPRPKEPAPLYDKLPPKNENLTDEELAEAQRIAHEETEKLRIRLRTG